MEIATISMDPHMLWNLVLTVIVIPGGWLIRSIFAEQKRIDILINKTREEVARDYVTREQMEQTFGEILLIYCILKKDFL